MPKIRVFGSQRAWIWAAVTLAAGLLIMFLQSRDKFSNNPPNVAMQNRAPADTQLADDVAQPSRRELSVSTPPGSASAPPASLSINGEPRDKFSASGGAMPATPMAGEAGGGQAEIVAHDRAPTGSPGIATASPKLEPSADGDKAPMRARDARSASTTTSNEPAKERSMTSPPASAVAGGNLGAASKKMSEPQASPPSSQRFIVVRVAAKPESLKNGAFERLLADNRIQFVPDASRAESLGVGGALTKSVKNESALKDQSKAPLESGASDMVLVEAPPAAIEACLADLNKNSTDFTSIFVSETTSFSGGFDARRSPEKKSEKASHDLSRFSRGDALHAQNEPVDTRRYLYDSELAKPTGTVASGTPRAGGVADEAGAIASPKQDANGNKTLAEQKQPPMGVRRARRMEASGTDIAQIDAPAAAAPTSPASASNGAVSRRSGGEEYKQQAPEQKPDQLTEAKPDADENLKVLFVFTLAETPAPSASPAVPPK